MPRGDRTGPNGNGPMTGRRMGDCDGRGGGRGFGGGYGFRGGYGNGFIPNVSEKTLLENDIKILKDQLSSLEKQLSEKKED